jgi:hypothetical protein
MLRGFDLGRPKAWPDANKLLNPTPYTEGAAPAAVRRYTFSRDAAYAKKLKAVASLDEIPEPPCGDWGEMPDGSSISRCRRVRGASCYSWGRTSR